MLESTRVDAVFETLQVDAAFDEVGELLETAKGDGSVDLQQGGSANLQENVAPSLPEEMLSNLQAAGNLSGVRVPFSAEQRIAPFDGNRMPDPSEFITVQCCDLATGGLSFLLAERPDFDTLVIAFGEPPEVVYQAAQVVHCSDVLVDPSGAVTRIDSQEAASPSPESDEPQSERMVQVGCRFTRRLLPDSD